VLGGSVLALGLNVSAVATIKHVSAGFGSLCGNFKVGALTDLPARGPAGICRVCEVIYQGTAISGA
jgi:hypothetical protein